MDSKALAGAAAPPPTLEENFAAKQAELQQAQDGIQQAQDGIKQNTQKVTSIQAEIAVLQAKMADIKQAIGGYDQQGLQRQLDYATKSITQKSGAAEVALGVKKAVLDAKIKKFDDDLNEAKKNVDKAEDEYNTAAKSTEEAGAKIKQTGDAYDAIKKKPSDIDAALRDVKSLLDQAKGAEGASDYVSVYFLCAEAKAVADKVQIISLEELNKSIRDAQDNAEKAKKDAADAKVTSDKLWADFTGAKKTYEATTVSRRAELLKNLKQ
jgi:chromosome segregation ATPase